MTDTPAAPRDVTPEQAPTKGDYVLATKFTDGEAWDPWFVGIYDCFDPGILPYQQGRHHVVGNDGQTPYPNGFRRCAVISREHGEWLLKHAKELEENGAKLWDKPEEWLATPPATTPEVAELQAQLSRLAAELDRIRPFLQNVSIGGIGGCQENTTVNVLALMAQRDAALADLATILHIAENFSAYPRPWDDVRTICRRAPAAQASHVPAPAAPAVVMPARRYLKDRALGDDTFSDFAQGFDAALDEVERLNAPLSDSDKQAIVDATMAAVQRDALAGDFPGATP